jgi:hypothetical protein
MNLDNRMSGWPVPLLAHLSQYGELRGFETLHGKSGAGVYRLDYFPKSVIVKASRSLVESRFYADAAPILRQQDIPIPQCEFAVRQADLSWLVLEVIPQRLPIQLGQVDSRCVAILARLHTLEAAHLPAPFRASWDDALTRAALPALGDTTAPWLEAFLADAQAQTRAIFRQECSVSGDPNLANWGQRDDGSLVLFDWERFGRATPALDLAICVPGLGSMAVFQTVAEAYLQLRPTYSLSLSALAREIALNKLWTMVEFLTLYTDPASPPDDTLAYLQREFVPWCATLRNSV